MHTFRACRGRFGADSADTRPFGAGCDAYSPTPLNTTTPVVRPVERGGSVPRDRHLGPARHAFLEADLEVGALYWLSDLTSGKEELPFYIDAMGRQVFPHAWWPDNGLRQAVRAD